MKLGTMCESTERKTVFRYVLHFAALHFEFGFCDVKIKRDKTQTVPWILWGIPLKQKDLISTLVSSI